jgi:hypothetical protein
MNPHGADEGRQLMRWYRSVWICGTVPVAALGLLGAVIAAPPVKLLSLALVVAIVATSLAWASGAGRQDSSVRTGPAGVGLVAVSATVVVVGLGSLLGGVVVVPLLLIGMLSPPVVGLVLRSLARSGSGHAPSVPSTTARAEAADSEPTFPRPRRSPEDHAKQPARTQVSRAVLNERPVFLTDAWMTQPAATLDGESLCLAWRKTSTVLRRELSLTVVETLARRRQELLDEMERRNGKGFRAWLASGARAAGDPSRYIVEES